MRDLRLAGPAEATPGHAGSGEWRGVGSYSAGEPGRPHPGRDVPAGWQASRAGPAQKGRSSSSASSASGKSSNDSFPLGAAAAALTLPADENASEPSARPDSMMSSRAVISVVARSWP